MKTPTQNEFGRAAIQGSFRLDKVDDKGGWYVTALTEILIGEGYDLDWCEVDGHLFHVLAWTFGDGTTPPPVIQKGEQVILVGDLCDLN